MTPHAERLLKRWRGAGLLDAATAERIHAWEAAQHEGQKLSVPVRVLIGLGGLAIAAGLLLFVAAHWDTLSPAARFALLVTTIAALHVGGGFATTRFPVLATTLHSVGTATLGGGIFLAAQIFNLQEHWPGGILMWAAGAWMALWLLRDRAQLAWVALLTPAWLIGEWVAAAENYNFAGVVAGSGLLLLAVAYMGSRRSPLGLIGEFALIPLAWLTAMSTLFATSHGGFGRTPELVPVWVIALGWALAFLGPLALTVLAFYFSSLFDKLGRSASLLTLGILLLAGGWLLERTRKRLLARMEGAA